MQLTFVPKEKDSAYIADQLWLPKENLRLGPLKGALEFHVQEQGRQKTLRLWSESTHHLICPREFLPPSHYPQYPFKFVDLRPEFQKVVFEDRVTLREDQEAAWCSLLVNDNGILNLSCGKGKTVLGAKKIAQRKVPTLIVVPDGTIYTQWERTLASCLKFDGEVGSIRGPIFNWAKPVTLALVTTLWQRIAQGAVPEEAFRFFGQILFDEVHQIGAPKFSLCASPFYGDRIGLTATVAREDGLDPVYLYNIGEPFYSDLSQDLVPRIYFQQTPVTLNYSKAITSNGIINTSVLRSHLGRDRVGNTYRYWRIREAEQSGRKILCVSHSLDQLKLFHAMFPGSSLIIGDTDKAARFDLVRGSRICFAIARLGSVGVDDPQLDTLFWLTPFRSRIALQQSMGRIQRHYEGKPTPVMVVFEDWTTPTLRKLCGKLKASLREWKYKFMNSPPERLPTELPADVESAYREAFAKLPEKGETCEEDE